MAGGFIAGQFDDPYQLDEKGIFDPRQLKCRRTWAVSPGGARLRKRRPGMCSQASTSFRFALEVPDQRHLSRRRAAQWRADAYLNGQSAPRLGKHQTGKQTQIVDPTNIITGLKGRWRTGFQVGRNALPLFDAGLVGNSTSDDVSPHRPDERT